MCIRDRFTPVAPFKGLTDYFVDVSPTTHRICAIYATGERAKAEDASRIMTLLDIILREKYTDDPPPVQTDALPRPRLIPLAQGDRAGSCRIEQRESQRYVETFYTMSGRGKPKRSRKRKMRSGKPSRRFAIRPQRKPRKAPGGRSEEAGGRTRETQGRGR